MNLENVKIAVIGQGYVGLPLAIEFGKKYETIGFDINSKRIEELKNGEDHTKEASREQLKSASHLSFHSDLEAIKSCNVYIVTVPTPIDTFKTPDLKDIVFGGAANFATSGGFGPNQVATAIGLGILKSEWVLISETMKSKIYGK